jgi:hypothetical protein
MADKHIAIYLNDHLAGFVAALEILEQLRRSIPARHCNSFLPNCELITADRQQLESLMGRLHIWESRSPRCARRHGRLLHRSH